MRFTEEQLRAIDLRGGNVLLSAAAGSGKTTVLVERVLKLIEEGTSVDRMLIVTFTRAAAADMRAKLQRELGARASAGDREMRRQQLLLERASISTLHAFCADFLRSHFERANVDPSFRILDDAEARRLTDEALDAALEEFYAEPDASAPDYARDPSGIREMADASALDYARGPKGVREMADALMRALDERPDPKAWLDKVCACGAELREAWIAELVGEAKACVTRARFFSELALRHPECTEGYANALRQDIVLLDEMRALTGYDEIQRALTGFKQARASAKGGSAGEEVQELRKQAKSALEKASIRALPLGMALADMDALAPQMRALGGIALRAMEAFEERKTEIGALTYADLEHKTLAALLDEDTARSVREAYDFVFVDEYQDTSDVQEALIGRITRGDNLFMVGDVKQSIYRFRQAEPKLFLEKYEAYGRGEGGTMLPLTRNFRSRPGILSFVNRVFERAMRGGDSEIVYDDAARLNLGDPELTGGGVELHILEEPDEADEELLDLKNCEREALFIAARIREMKRENPSLGYRDFAVITRTKKGVLGKMAAVLAQAGIPAFADGADDFYDSMEITLALALLKLTANRRSDVELIGALRSPMVGLTDEELARIRLSEPDVPFADAAEIYAMREDETARRMRDFFDLCARWRLLARSGDLGALCRRIFAESGLTDCAGALPGGAQRQANLARLAASAAEFDRNVSGSLTRFLTRTDQLRAQGGGDEAHLLGENDDVVRLMTVHKSKGLEFPIVFGAMLSRKFSARTGSPALSAHRDLGLGCLYCDPVLQTRRRTLAQAAIAAREKREDRAEELRILYVLLTRAKDRLILTASVKDAETLSARKEALKMADGAANSALDVILAAQTEDAAVLHTDINFDIPEAMDALPETEAEPDARLMEKLMWRYPDEKASGQPLKLTVTGLLRQLQSPDEVEPLIARPAFLSEVQGGMRGMERGTAYHRAMQCVELKSLEGLDPRAMTAEIARQMDVLTESGRMTRAQRDAVQPNIIARFFEGETGRRLRQADEARREWSFNVMMRISEALTEDEANGCAEEEILVQGTIDCCFIEDGGWVLLDYKTDRTTDADALTERYRSQLRLYALALERITGIPVKEIRLCLLISGEEIILFSLSASPIPVFTMRIV